MLQDIPFLATDDPKILPYAFLSLEAFQIQSSAMQCTEIEGKVSDMFWITAMRHNQFIPSHQRLFEIFHKSTSILFTITKNAQVTYLSLTSNFKHQGHQHNNEMIPSRGFMKLWNDLSDARRHLKCMIWESDKLLRGCLWCANLTLCTT